jgi:hypothetical protein
MEKTQKFFCIDLPFKREPDLKDEKSFRQKNGFPPTTGIE